jgi:hypothetical protein
VSKGENVATVVRYAENCCRNWRLNWCAGPVTQPRQAKWQPDGDQFFFSTALTAKRLELLRELVPAAVRVAVLVNPANAANAETSVRDVEAAADAIGLHLQIEGLAVAPELLHALDRLRRGSKRRLRLSLD